MLIRARFFILMAFLAIVLPLSYGFINGFGCNYQLGPFFTGEDTLTNLTCYRGTVVAIHHKKSGEEITWRVEARQFNYGDQVIYMVYSRERISHNNEGGEIDIYNRTASAFNLLFYLFKVHGNKVYIFEQFPKEGLYVTNIYGQLSLVK